MRKDPSVPTSITLQLCEDSILIKDASGKTKIASADDDKRIAKIIRDIATDTEQPELDIHNIKVTNAGATNANGNPLENLDITDVESLKKLGLAYAMNFVKNKI